MKRKCVHLKKYLICLVLLVLVFPSCDGGRDKDQKFKILTGPRDGIYYEFMKGLIKRLEDMPYEPIDTSNNNVVLYNTPGSVYNLERLSQGQANFAIAQADVISETAARRGYDIYGVAPLFREYIFIFRLLPVSETPRVEEFDPLKVKHIYIPGEGAGTYLTAKRFLDLAEVDPGKIVNDGMRVALSKMVEEARDEKKFDYFLFAVLNRQHPLIRDISDGRLDGWDTGTNPPTPAWRTNGKRNQMWDLYDSLNFIPDGENKTPGYPVELVSLPGETRKSMKDLYGIYENTPIPIKDIGGPGDFTLFMRAFLVVRSDEKEENVEVLLDYFYKDKKFRETIAGTESTDSIGRIGGVPIEKPAQIKWPMPIHMGAYKTLSREEVIEDTKPGRSWAFIYWVLFLLILVFWVILVFMEKMIEGIQKGTSTMRKKSLHLMYKRRNIIAAISVVLLVVIFTCSPCFINDIEVSASRVYGYESPFNNMEIPEVSGWLLIFTISGTEQGIFPSNPYSKTILFLLNIVLKVMTPLIIAFYAAQWVRNLIKKPGLQKKGFSKHVVFIGWNKAYSSLVKKVVEVNETFKFVIITPDITNPNPLEDSDLPANKVGLVQGSPLDTETLKKACIDQAQCIYLVSSSSQKNNYLTWLPVSFDNFMTRLYNEKKLGSIPPIYILDPEDDVMSVLEKLEFKNNINVLKRPPEYDKLVRSLFFGSGIYSILAHWVKLRCQKKKDRINKELALSEEILEPDGNNLAKVEKKWKIDRQTRKKGMSPFAELLNAQDNHAFIEAYKKVDQTLVNQGSLLVGVSLKYILKSDNMEDKESTWDYFSDPIPVKDTKTEDNKTEDDETEVYKFEKIEKAILYIMNSGGK